jgi:hypothetical protein
MYITGHRAVFSFPVNKYVWVGRNENKREPWNTQKEKKRINNNNNNKIGLGEGGGAVISQYSSVVRRYDSKIERDGRRRQSGETRKTEKKI